MAITRFRADSAGILRWPGGEARCALGKGGVTPAESLQREGDGRDLAWACGRRGQALRARRPSGAPCNPPPDRRPDPRSRLVRRSLQPALQLPRRATLPLSHEKLWRDDGVYDVIVVLGYNDDPPVRGKGSAIFLHVARPDYSPTEGCVACARADLLALLATAKLGDTLTIVR